jgi:hypothetical protein
MYPDAEAIHMLGQCIYYIYGESGDEIVCIPVSPPPSRNDHQPLLRENFLTKIYNNNKIFAFAYQFFNFDQPCKDGPGQPGQDSQCSILSTGHLGQGMEDKTEK